MTFRTVGLVAYSPHPTNNTGQDMAACLSLQKLDYNEALDTAKLQCDSALCMHRCLLPQKALCPQTALGMLRFRM